MLSQRDVERINEESLRVLWETGVAVDDDGIVALLGEHGCKIDAGRRIVRFPRDVVAKAVERSPSEVKLASLSGEETVLSPGGPTVIWTGNAINLVGPDGVRPMDTKLYAGLAHVVDGLEHVHGMVGTSLADVPPPVRGLVGFRLIAENCLKHIRPVIFDPRETTGMVEMAQVLLDGKPLAENPIFSLGYTAVSPLRWTDLALNAFRESSGHRIPMMVNSEPAGGVTAPATLAGELVLANAEALSGVVICQALEPGRPLIFNLGFAHVMDMATSVMRTGSVENSLLQSAGARIAQFHKLPSASWMSTESCLPDAGAGYEYMQTGLMHVLDGVNVIWGVGNLESTKCMSSEMAVIGNDIAGAILRAKEGIRVDDETLATELILEMGRRPEYLVQPHTLEHFRREYYFPHVTNRRSRSAWEAAGKPNIAADAAARVRELAARPVRSLVAPAMREKLLKIEQKWRGALVK